MSRHNAGGRIALLLSAAHVTTIFRITYTDNPGRIALLSGFGGEREGNPIALPGVVKPPYRDG
jgi:hypothetical protein